MGASKIGTTDTPCPEIVTRASASPRSTSTSSAWNPPTWPRNWLIVACPSLLLPFSTRVASSPWRAAVVATDRP
jgi:hypothetical protein